MNTNIYVALIAWTPAVLCIFALLPIRRAVATAFVVGTLFLPVVDQRETGTFLLNKASIVALPVSCALLFSAATRARNFRFCWFDLPILAYICAPMASALSNGLGWYDGAHVMTLHALTWGMPYFIGRLYLSDYAGSRELAIAIVLGGIVYLPLCVYEIRMSPQLHTIVYGTSFFAGERLGGWRPSVFLRTGLMLGLWMTSASLIGVWLWQTGYLRYVSLLRRGWPIGLLLVIAILCRSSGAILLLAVGYATLLISRAIGHRWVFAGLMALPLAYMATRTTREWNGIEFAAAVAKLDSGRAGSFLFRLENEDRLIEKALQRPVLGWGGWGRARVYDAEGRDISISEGFWVIEIGQGGIFGLVAAYSVLLLPIGLLVFRGPVVTIQSTRMAPVTSLAVVVTLFSIDCLMNDMFNPVYLLAAGAVVGLFANPGEVNSPTSDVQFGRSRRGRRTQRLRRLSTGEASDRVNLDGTGEACRETRARTECDRLHPSEQSEEALRHVR